jgi:hypothetical protein
MFIKVIYSVLKLGMFQGYYKKKEKQGVFSLFKVVE